MHTYEKFLLLQEMQLLVKCWKEKAKITKTSKIPSPQETRVKSYIKSLSSNQSLVV